MFSFVFLFLFRFCVFALLLLLLSPRKVMVTRDTTGDRTFAGFGGGKPSDSFADCHHRSVSTMWSLATVQWGSLFQS